MRPGSAIFHFLFYDSDAIGGGLTMSERDIIMATLEEYAAAYCAKDLNRLMAIFADGDGISLIGTGADELCSGRAEVSAVFERNFRDATATEFVWQWVDIIAEDDTGCVAASLDIHLTLDGDKIVVPVRWSVVLNKVGGKWLWLHRHASSAAGEQKDGAAYPVSEG